MKKRADQHDTLSPTTAMLAVRVRYIDDMTAISTMTIGAAVCAAI